MPQLIEFLLKEILPEIRRKLRRHEKAIRQIRRHMAYSDELVARFEAALARIEQKVTDLDAKVEAQDGVIGAKFEPGIARLEALGADPAPEVPSEPAPEVPVDPAPEAPVDPAPEVPAGDPAPDPDVQQPPAESQSIP